MLKKLLKDTVSSAKKAGEEIKKTMDDEGFQKKAKDFFGDGPVPLSGLIQKTKPKQQPTEKTVKEKELPRASRRVPSLEQAILVGSKEIHELSAYAFEKCILPEATCRLKESDGFVTGRIIRAFLAGRETTTRCVVREVLLSQRCNEPFKDTSLVDDDSLFNQNPFTFLSMEEIVHEISEETLNSDIKTKVRNVLSPVLVFNSLSQSIKLQSTNLETDGYQSLTIPALGRKSFMYHSENGSGIRISYANSGKLIKHIPVEQVPFDSIKVP